MNGTIAQMEEQTREPQRPDASEDTDGREALLLELNEALIRFLRELADSSDSEAA